MNTPTGNWLLTLAIAGLCAFTSAAYAQNTEPAAPPSPPAVEAPDTNAPAAADSPNVEATDADAPAAQSNDEAHEKWNERWRSRGGHRNARWRHSDNDVVTIGGNSSLAKGDSADSVVSVFGSSTSEGDVSDAVVSVLGDTRVEGPVGDAAVAVLGDNFVNSKVSGDVVAVLGNVELGPNAIVEGNVVVVGGTLHRDPAAVIKGGIQNVFGVTFGSFRWLRPWVEHCLLYGRPLAFASGIGWAWTVALAFLALYVLIAFMFQDKVDRCVRTFEAQPGQTFVAALLGMLLTPVLFALLFITVIGIAFIPLVGLGMFIASAFGKVVVLAWFGRFCTKTFNKGETLQAAAAVAIGGAIVLALYLVPVVGFIVYKLLGILGFGVAAYALILVMRERRNELSPPPASAEDVSMTSGTASGPSDNTGIPGGAQPGAAAFSAGASGTAGNTGTGGPTDEASAMAASALPRASLSVRMGALFIDAVLVSILLGVLDHSRHGELLALAAYGAVMWKLKGTTIGGIVFGLKVVRIDGRPIDWATAVVRALSCFLSLIVVGLGFITIAFDQGKQGWHDKIAGTAVVRVPKGVSLL